MLIKYDEFLEFAVRLAVLAQFADAPVGDGMMPNESSGSDRSGPAEMNETASNNLHSEKSKRNNKFHGG